MTTASLQVLYRVRRVAQMLDISESKTWELLARGDIESVKIDGSRRVSREALEAYVKRLADGGGAA